MLKIHKNFYFQFGKGKKYNFRKVKLKKNSQKRKNIYMNNSVKFFGTRLF